MLPHQSLVFSARVARAHTILDRWTEVGRCDDTIGARWTRGRRGVTAGAPSADTDENTEILVKTYPNEYVVTLQLEGDKFQDVLNDSAVVTQAAVSDFIEKWKASREAIACETDPLKMFRMKQIRNWEGLTLRVKKWFNQHAAQEEHSEWNFAVGLSLADPASVPLMLMRANPNPEARADDEEAPLRHAPGQDPSNQGQDWQGQGHQD